MFSAVDVRSDPAVVTPVANGLSDLLLLFAVALAGIVVSLSAPAGWLSASTAVEFSVEAPSPGR